MKKILCIALLTVSLFVSNTYVNASSLEVTQLLGLAQSTQTAASTAAIAESSLASQISNAATAVSTEIIKIKTTLYQEFSELAWVKELKAAWDALEKMQKTVNEIVGLRDDFMSTLSGVRDLGNFAASNISPQNQKDTIDYRYASQLPNSYAIGHAFIGKAAANNSNTNRNNWKVTGDITSYNVEQLSKSAAEINANQIAVIQAMAQEAFMQANNRIKKIEELQEKISGLTKDANAKAKVTSPKQKSWELEKPEYKISDDFNLNTDAAGGANTAVDTGADTTKPDPNIFIEGNGDDSTSNISNSGANNSQKNDLKYIADLQAQIQVQQALLQNEQNKLAALAILQQSQRDSYEQRKKEIADYAVNKKGNEVMTTVGVALAQSLSYKTIASWYK